MAGVDNFTMLGSATFAVRHWGD